MTISIVVTCPDDVEAVVIELWPPSKQPGTVSQRQEHIVEPGKQGIFHTFGEKQVFVTERASLKDRIKSNEALKLG